MVSELNYMSQIVIMLYEDPTKDPYSEERWCKLLMPEVDVKSFVVKIQQHISHMVILCAEISMFLYQS
jgi:hypothetical protein